MAIKVPVIQRNTDYIFSDAVWTATVAASTSYAVTDFQYLFPAKRILWGVKTVTITATIPSRRGDIFALPFSNLDAGSGVLAITNNGGAGGVNQAITIPAQTPGGWMPTAWIDLSDPTLNGGSGWSTGQRTATVWNFVVTANSVNLLMGAAIWMSGPARYLAHNLDRVQSPKLGRTYARSVTTNDYDVDLVYDYGTMKRSLTGTYVANSTAERDNFENWIDGCHGGGLPGLFVRDGGVNDALLGYMNAQLVTETVVYPIVSSFSLTVTELSKGKHL